MKYVFMLVVLISGITTAQADHGAVDFQALAIDTLTSARLANLEEIDGISIRELLELASVVVPTPARIEVGDRKSALWTSTGISYDPDLFRQMHEFDARVLSVHEYLGHKYGQMKDDGYPYSIYITMRSRPRYRALLKDLVWPTAYTRKTFVTVAKSGGSTVVGGGGDGRDIRIKREPIDALVLMQESGKTELLGQPLGQIFRGLLFVNFYRSEKAAKEHFNLYIPRDPSIQPVVLTHPETFEALLLKMRESARIIEMWKLGILFSENVLK